MNRVIAAFKKVRLRQILMTFLAGVLLFVSTACNSAGAKTGVGGNRQEVPSGLQSETGVQAKNPRPEVPDAATTNRFQGGTMNEFSDVDPRTKQAGAAADKAAALKENAERNVIDQTSDVGENTRRILDKKGENAEDLGKNLSRSAEDTKYKAQNTADNLGKAAKQGVENVKDSTVNATKDATSGLNRSANRAGENVKESTKQVGRDVANKAQRAAEGTPELVQNKANEAGKNTSNFIQDKVNQFVRGTERNVDKAADAVNNAVD